MISDSDTDLELEVAQDDAKQVNIVYHSSVVLVLP